MKPSRRRFLHLAGAAAVLPSAPRFACAQSYPARPVHLIVAFPAGSAPDIIARLAGQHLSKRLGQQFVIENRPGAASNIGTEYVAKAAPDRPVTKPCAKVLAARQHPPPNAKTAYGEVACCPPGMMAVFCR